MPIEHEARADYLAQRAASGAITQQERDELLALIYCSLWSLKDLNEQIEKVHCRLCEQCELKRLVTAKRGLVADLLSAIRGNKLPWVIVALLLAIIAAMLGVDLGEIMEVVK